MANGGYIFIGIVLLVGNASKFRTSPQVRTRIEKNQNEIYRKEEEKKNS